MYQYPTIHIIWELVPVFDNFEDRVKILYFVDRVYQYIRVMKTNLMHCLSSACFISQPVHVSGIFSAHHQEVYYIYIYTHNNWYVLCFLVD